MHHNQRVALAVCNERKPPCSSENPAQPKTNKYSRVCKNPNSQSLTLFYVKTHFAKSLQLCPSLCDPVDRSLPGSSVHGILQARILEWVVISFSTDKWLVFWKALPDAINSLVAQAPFATPRLWFMNKTSGGDGIPTELFKILKDGAVKMLHWICQQIWKNQQWPQDWKKPV